MPCSRKLPSVILSLTATLACAMGADVGAGSGDSGPEDSARRYFLKMKMEERAAAKADAAPQGDAVQLLPEVPAAPKKKKKEKAEATESAATAEPEGEAGDEGKKKGQKQPVRWVLPLPIGQDSKGLVIPIADPESGRKSLSFDIGVARRIDDDHVKMTGLVIETYGEEPPEKEGTQEKEMTIELPDSMMDMKTGIITGKTRVTIKRSDFQITGRTMEFDTNTKQGNIQGDVKMTIYDLNLEATPPPATQPKAGG